MRIRTLLWAWAALLVAFAVGCAPATQGAAPSPATSVEQSTAPAPQPAARGTIVFDTAHGEIFKPEDTTELGQSDVVSRMNQAGYEVRVNTQPIEASTLDGVAALYVPGPMRPFTPEEQTVLDDYLERGGTVILSIHVPYPVMGLPARWGLPVRPGIMANTASNAGPEPSVFETDAIVDDPLTQDVKGIVVLSGWPVDTDPTKLATAKLVVLAKGLVAADTNANGAYDPGDEQQPFGVVGVAPVGSGRVVVLGDDAIFANIGMGQADNAKLLENILEMISAPKGA